MASWAVAAEVAVSGYRTDPPELVLVLSGASTAAPSTTP